MTKENEIEFAAFEKVTRPFHVREYERPNNAGFADFPNLQDFFRAVSRNAPLHFPMIYRVVRGEKSAYYFVAKDNTVLFFEYSTAERDRAIHEAKLRDEDE